VDEAEELACIDVKSGGVSTVATDVVASRRKVYGLSKSRPCA